MNHYEQKQEDKRQRYLDLADKAEAESTAAWTASGAAIEGIPFGQPILVGHHSEKGHRAAIKRSHNAMDRMCNASKKAEHYRSKAAGVGHAGISSDDPEAVTKLLEKINTAEEKQDLMKKANRIVKGKKLTDDQKVEKLCKDITQITTNTARLLLEPDFCGRIGFASYELSNNNANIRRMKSRVAELRAQATLEAKEYEPFDGLTVIHNTDENRIQFVFDGKPPAATRSQLKSHGFRWAPSQGAWQRQLNGNGLYAAKMVLVELQR